MIIQFSITLHRAIDLVSDPIQAVKQVMMMMQQVPGISVDRILTSGGAKTAIEGKETIAAMVCMPLLEGEVMSVEIDIR